MKIRVGLVDDIPPGTMTLVQLDSQNILIANLSGLFYAMNDDCNHTGAPLHEGSLEGNNVICPHHGSQWDVTTGKLVWFSKPLADAKVYSVIVEDEEIFIEK